MTTHQDIYAQLEKLLEPASLPAPWHRLPAPPDYRAPLRDFQAAVDLLRQKFAVDDLLSSGVLIRRGPGAQAATRLAIHPCLVLGPLLLLRRKSGQPPYEIVSAGGCISGSEPPLLAALHDAATQRLLESGGTLFATFTVQDAAILQGLGLPAMPAVGLKKLQGSHFDKFCAALDVRPLITDPWAAAAEEEEEEEEEDEEEEDDDKEDENKVEIEDEIEDEVCGDEECVEDDNPSVASPPPVTSVPPPIPPPELQKGEPATQAALPHPDPPVAQGQPSPPPSDPRRQDIVPKDIELCFVAWNLAQLSLDEPEQLAAVDAHLRELAGNLDLLMDQIFVWRPAPDLAPKLRYALTQNLPKYVRGTLASSHNRSTRSLIVRESAPPSQPLTIREAWEPLQQGGERQNHFRSANVQDYHQMIYREVTEPLLKKAEALTDPALKVRFLVQTHYVSQQLKLLPQLGLGEKAPQPSINGLLSSDDTDLVRAAQKFLSDFLDATDPARKISSR